MEGLLSMRPSPSSFLKVWRKRLTEYINQLIGNGGDCRTALATPGLLKIHMYYEQSNSSAPNACLSSGLLYVNYREDRLNIKVGTKSTYKTEWRLPPKGYSGTFGGQYAILCHMLCYLLCYAMCYAILALPTSKATGSGILGGFQKISARIKGACPHNTHV